MKTSKEVRYRHQEGANCGECLSRDCTCPERQSDGSWIPQPKAAPTNKEEEILKEFREKVAGNEYYFTISRDDDYNENYEEWEKWLTKTLSEVRSEGAREATDSIIEYIELYFEGLIVAMNPAATCKNIIEGIRTLTNQLTNNSY